MEGAIFPCIFCGKAFETVEDLGSHCVSLHSVDSVRLGKGVFILQIKAYINRYFHRGTGGG
jgi:hypothetical protein